MATAYIGEIMTFGGMFVPYGWLPCDGSLQQISTYDALFQLIGTTFGGDGQTTFALPNLKGGALLHQGQLAGGQNYAYGQTGGTSSVALTSQQLPVHGHPLNAVSNPSSGTATPGSSAVLADAASSAPMYAVGPTTNATLAPSSITPTGSSAPHPNLQPVMGIITCICVDGVFPSRS